MQLVDYLNGMWYMICLPSLLCGLAISVEDIRSRRIPRAWIATGCTAQIIVNLIYALSINTLYLALQAILFAVLSAVLQCALALVKPGSLGFGDVTATLLMGLAVGMFGLFACYGSFCGHVSIRRSIPHMPVKRRSPQRLWQLGR